MCSGTCQQFVEDAVKVSNIFLDFRLSQGSVATCRRWGGSLCMCVHRKFTHKSVGEKILKIGPHLQKLLSNIKWLPFLRFSVQQTLTNVDSYVLSRNALHTSIYHCFFFIIYIWRYSLNKFNHDFVKLQCNMCKCSTWLSSRLSQTSWTSSCKSLRPCSHSVMSISTTDQYNYEDFCCALSVNYLCDCVE